MASEMEIDITRGVEDVSTKAASARRGTRCGRGCRPSLEITIAAAFGMSGVYQLQPELLEQSQQ